MSPIIRIIVKNIFLIIVNSKCSIYLKVYLSFSYNFWNATRTHCTNSNKIVERKICIWGIIAKLNLKYSLKNDTCIDNLTFNFYLINYFFVRSLFFTQRNNDSSPHKYHSLSSFDLSEEYRWFTFVRRLF